VASVTTEPLEVLGLMRLTDFRLPVVLYLRTALLSVLALASYTSMGMAASR
jgi:hypothetical protein